MRLSSPTLSVSAVAVFFLTSTVWALPATRSDQLPPTSVAPLASQQSSDSATAPIIRTSTSSTSSKKFSDSVKWLRKTNEPWATKTGTVPGKSSLDAKVGDSQLAEDAQTADEIIQNLLKNAYEVIEGTTYWSPKDSLSSAIRFPGPSSTIILKKDADTLTGLNAVLTSALIKSRTTRLMAPDGGDRVVFNKLAQQISKLDTLNQDIKSALERYGKGLSNPFAQQIAQLEKDGKMKNAQREYQLVQKMYEDAWQTIITKTNWWPENHPSNVPTGHSPALTPKDRRAIVNLYTQLGVASAVNADAVNRVTKQGDTSIAVDTLKYQRSMLDSLHQSIASAIANYRRV